MIPEHKEFIENLRDLCLKHNVEIISERVQLLFRGMPPTSYYVTDYFDWDDLKIYFGVGDCFVEHIKNNHEK